MTVTNELGHRGEAPDWGRRIGIKSLWTEIVPGLWVGGTADDDTVEDGRRIGMGPYNVREEAAITADDFDAVVTLYAWANPVDWLVEELRWGIYDSPDGTLDLEGIKETVDWAHRRWSKGKRVLIRCQAGLNRSGLITALVLVKAGYAPSEAISLIRTQRCGECLFNKAFVRTILTVNAEAWQ